ncbi:hypothetical protein ACJ72_04555 [Emergomyces africanus]|uniref:Uncharacterized protein n=1 Tax=Emergomyces africanus TaxID=1955775 RepID=A0A1B7NWE0_9EURO|nr:hypothetical protein ACJ72_04555 [Emergomyces africanus]
MFATIAQPATPFTNIFSLPPQPRHPSPLAPRHAANLSISHSRTTMSSSSSKPQSPQTTTDNADKKDKTITPSPSLPKQFYADRYARQIRNPAAQIARQHGSREKRRDMFLNKVKRDRDEGRIRG